MFHLWYLVMQSHGQVDSCEVEKMDKKNVFVSGNYTIRL